MTRGSNSWNVWLAILSAERKKGNARRKVIFHASSYVPTPCLGSVLLASFRDRSLFHICICTYIFLLERRKTNNSLELFVSASPFSFLTLISFVPPFYCFRSLKRFDRTTGASYPSLESVSVEFTRLVNSAVVARGKLNVVSVKGYKLYRRFEKKKSKTRDSSSSTRSFLDGRGNEKASIEFRARK